MKNSIQNLSYFTKRLRDNNFIVWKIFDGYNIGDPRKWTILINPGYESVYITCYVNEEVLENYPSFIINDGGIRFNSNIKIKTKSMEVIINELITKGVRMDSTLFKKEDNEK